MNKRQVYFFVLTATTFALSGCNTIAGFKSGGSLCKQLSVVLDSAGGRFDSVKGAAIGKASWDTTAPLPDMRQCSVEKVGDPGFQYYTCEAMVSNDKAAEDARYAELKQKVQACLGAAWSPREYRRSDGMITRFKTENTSAYVSVRTYKNFDDFWLLKVQVDSD